VLHRFGATLVFFNAPYFKKRVLEVAAAHPGIKWLIVDGSTINSIDSTGAAMLEALSEDLRARGIRLGFANPRTEACAFFGTLRSTGCTRRWCAMHHTQISRGCLRLRRVRRNIGNRKRTLAGTRTRGIPVRATRLTPHTGDPFVTLCAKEIHYRSVALLIIYMSRKQLYIRHSLSYPAPIGDAKPYCEKSFLLDEFLRFDTELVTGKRRDSKLELPLREDVTTRQAAVFYSQRRLSEVIWMCAQISVIARMGTNL